MTVSKPLFVLFGICLWIAAGHADAQEGDARLQEALQRIAPIVDDPVQQEAARTLWHRDLDAPVAVHDSASGRTMRLDRASHAPVVVELPANLPPANTCIDIAGTPMVLLMLPLPEDDYDLATLVWHERWHCAQVALRLPGRRADNAHLDSESGRVWLRLELRALVQALQADDDARARAHASAALAFRAQRSPDATLATGPLLEEAALERNEGLAEYSGRRIAGRGADMRPVLVQALAAGDDSESYVRSIAYLTGPAYGVLLDRWSPQWRTRLTTESDLPSMLAQALDATSAGAEEATRLATAYDAATIRAQEAARAQERARRAADYRRELVTGSVLRITLESPSVSFDPRTLFPLGEDGTVYRPITVNDRWGRLTAEQGGLMAPDWDRFSVQGTDVAGCGTSWTGPGWNLELAPGWKLAKAGDDWTIVAGTPAPCAGAEPGSEAAPAREPG